MNLTKTKLLLLLPFFIAVKSKAQDNTESCLKKDRSPAGINASHLLHKGEWMAGYRIMHSKAQKIVSGEATLSAQSVYNNYIMAPQSMQMNMQMGMLMYGISDRLTLMGMCEYNSMSMKMTMPASKGHEQHGGTSFSGGHEMSSAGWGDTKLNLLAEIFRSNKHYLILSPGVSLPTGKSGATTPAADPMYSGQPLPYTMQTGSGTFASFSQLTHVFHTRKISVGSQLQSTVQLGYNKQNYRKGNEHSLNNWISYAWCKHSFSSLRTEFVVNGEMKGYNPALYRFMEPAANPANTGGRSLNVYAGSTFMISGNCIKNTCLKVEYGIPVYRYYNGIQQASNYSINCSALIIF